MSTLLDDLTNGPDEDSFDEEVIIGQDETPKHKFKITYSLSGKQYVDEALAGILSMRGIDFRELPRERIEEIYLDFSYYKTTLLLARKELLRVYLRAKNDFAIWLAGKRKKARGDLQEVRKLYKLATGIKMADITTQELDDEVLSDCGKEHLEREMVVEELKEDMEFLKDQIKDLDSRRIQLQSIVKFRFG